MADKRRPWGKWYWGDWRKDARLRRCSYAARGLWIDMLSLMAGECEPIGFLIMEGQQLGPSDLASLLGGSPKEISKMLTDLEAKNVFSRAGGDLPKDIVPLIPASVSSGTILSRRMLRDKARDERDRQNGLDGGNPNLKPNGNGGVNPPNKAQMLEARYQIPDKKEEGLPTEACPIASQADLDVMVKVYNETAVRLGLPVVRELRGARKQRAFARLRIVGIDDWTQAMRKLEGSSFAQGNNDNGWRADFDFLLQDKSFNRLMEGSYDGIRNPVGGRRTGLDEAEGTAAMAAGLAGIVDAG